MPARLLWLGCEGAILMSACVSATPTSVQGSHTPSVVDGQSSSSAKWLPKLLISPEAVQLALDQKVDPQQVQSVRGLQVISAVILTDKLVRNPEEWELRTLKVDSENQLHLGLRFCPKAAPVKSCQQRDFKFDLETRQFPLVFFRSATTREGEVSSLVVDYKAGTARSCIKKLNENESCYPETLIPNSPRPTFVGMPEAFSFTPSLEMRILYGPSSPTEAKPARP